MSETLKIVGELTVFSAADLKPRLLAHLNGNDAPAVDLAGVTEFDTCGVQLMMLARREAVAAGKRLSFTGHSEAVLNGLTALQLSSELGPA